MIALVIAIFAAAWLLPEINAAEDNSQIQVHGSVIFARTGERTPVLESNTPRILTSLGANQMYELGSNFRGRYINSFDGHIGLGQQPISGLSSNVVNNDEIYILTTDSSYTIASAQAFMQGLYPPFTLNETTAQMLDATNILANGSYIDYPLSGYQYPSIYTASDLEPMSVWIEGSANCPANDVAIEEYYDTKEFWETRNSSMPLYWATGFNTMLSDVLVESQWDYSHAYLIYDYLNYQYSHDQDTYELFSENDTFAGAYDELRFLADQQEWGLYGNISADSDSQIRAIAGKTLAAKVLGQFQQLVSASGETPKLTLFVGEHEPFVSFFSLAELQFLNSNFFGMPEYASAMVFELFSVGNNDSGFPTDETDLWIRFHFHNGTDIAANGTLQSFPMFNRGPSQTDMPWLDFEDMIPKSAAPSLIPLQTSSVLDWCNACSSQAFFCLAFDDTIVINSTSHSSDMTPQVAGVIGAAVTLGVLLIAFILALLVGGIRFQKVTRGKKSELGGFKGSDKLHSDADLNLPKNGAVAGIVSMGNGDKKEPKERVGSWELRAKEGGKDMGDSISRRESLDEEAGVSPYAKPVAPNETV
ncbi:phosphoglycerate mutase-like protein [Mytilinidion resinicola]|uniref:Phosphoglycerate mutase-like protein n=1 Tax=Mytilinidion resinicola TaxID=574789 RepID=A0A6A6YY47_9PEZI|nr:phosphoglycerate mutase-like protein [Mytilinidion resinicola]KAF2813419.1 phosphoglycerate mutase-like protein [Mytilinidion resinicola]